MTTFTREPESHVSIAFSDCDPFGHLNNSRYIDYFLNEREKHVHHTYDFSLAAYAAGKKCGWFTVQNQVSYIKPARYGEQVLMISRLLGFDEHRLHLEMVMMNRDRSHVKAVYWGKFIHVDLVTGRKEGHPAELQSLFGSILFNAEETERENFDARTRQVLDLLVPGNGMK